MSKEKQIEEMAKALCPNVLTEYCASGNCTNPNCLVNAKALEALYDAGYRKQSEGEWVKDNTSKFENRYNCSVCDYRFFGIPTPYCPKCGAKMGGGE
jgi:rubrerythrin